MATSPDLTQRKTTTPLRDMNMDDDWPSRYKTMTMNQQVIPECEFDDGSSDRIYNCSSAYDNSREFHHNAIMEELRNSLLFPGSNVSSNVIFISPADKIYTF